MPSGGGHSVNASGDEVLAHRDYSASDDNFMTEESQNRGGFINNAIFRFTQDDGTLCPPLAGGEFADRVKRVLIVLYSLAPCGHYCPRKILTIKDEVKIKLFKYFRVFISRRLCG